MLRSPRNRSLHEGLRGDGCSFFLVALCRVQYYGAQHSIRVAKVGQTWKCGPIKCTSYACSLLCSMIARWVYNMSRNHPPLFLSSIPKKSKFHFDFVVFQGGFCPECSSGNQKTTSRSALAHILYRGFHSTTLALPLHGRPHIGLSSLVSISTCPNVSHTIASRSPPDPPTRYLPSALKQTSPWPSGPGLPGAARRFTGCCDRTQ